MSTFQKMVQSLSSTPLKNTLTWARANITAKQIGAVSSEFSESYAKKYFKTGSVRPVVHVMLGLGVLGYAMEYPHLKHSQRNRKHH
eukprot:m.98200 g.98200  ORF g.98200 m.98200 type:complete len:86 (-) comp12514_c0_seq1:3247-3504(-)